MTNSAKATPARGRDAERTRRDILHAALTCFTEKGELTTIAEVAAAAGISKGGLLHHFPSRDSLLQAMATEAMTQFQAEVFTFLDLSENYPGKMLRAYVRALCGGSPHAMSYFSFSNLWLVLQRAPGVPEVVLADSNTWNELFAQDGLSADTVLIVRNAAEGLAAAATYDPTMSAQTLEHARDLLLGMTVQ